MNKFAGSLKLYFTQYREVSAFAQFGSDLVASELLKQGLYLFLSTTMPTCPTCLESKFFFFLPAAP